MRILEENRVDPVPLGDLGLLVRGAQIHQLNRALWIFVPGPHRAGYLGDSTARDAGLSVGLDREPDAASPVELPPSDGEIRRLATGR